MEVWNGQQLLGAFFHPGGGLGSLAFGTMAVSAGIVVFDKSGVLSRSEAEGLLSRPRRELLQVLREKLAGRVDKAYLFGSRAGERHHGGSDLDLIVVTASQLPFHHRRNDFEDLFDLVPALDLLVYTPQEFKKLTTNPSPGFWRDVTAEMIEIF